MNRALLLGVAAFSVLAAGTSMAASSKPGQNHTGPSKDAVAMQRSENCHTLSQQYEMAIKDRKADAALASAQKDAESAKTSCTSGYYSRGADQYRAALKQIGVKPKV